LNIILLIKSSTHISILQDLTLKIRILTALAKALISIYLIACSDHGGKIEAERNRIISLSPHITEIIFALQVQEDLVAVTDFCKYPLEVQTKTTIGGLLNPDIERIIRINPTHLFGIPAHEELNRELKKFNLEINMMPNENISDVLNTIRTIGGLVNRSAQAARLMKSLKDSLDRLKSEAMGFRAMLIIGKEKGTLRNITVTGPNTFIDEIWHLVGGDNIFYDLPTRYGSISLEAIVERNPDIIIEFDVTGDRAVLKQPISAEWNLLKSVNAIKNNDLYLVRGNHCLIPGPRMILLAKDFHHILQLTRND
jgi:iron complex transport system substrate-binding protein